MLTPYFILKDKAIRGIIKLSFFLNIYRCVYRCFALIDFALISILSFFRLNLHFYSTGRLGDYAIDIIFLLELLKRDVRTQQIHYYVKPYLVEPLTDVLGPFSCINIHPFPPLTPLSLPLWRNIYGQSDFLLKSSRGAQASYNQLSAAGHIHLWKSPLAFPRSTISISRYVLSDYLSNSCDIKLSANMPLGNNPVLIVNPQPLSGQLSLQETEQVNLLAVELAALGLNVYCTNSLSSSASQTYQRGSGSSSPVKILSLSLASLLQYSSSWSMLLGIPSGPFWFSISSKISYIFAVCPSESIDIISDIITFRSTSDMKSSHIYDCAISRMLDT